MKKKKIYNQIITLLTIILIVFILIAGYAYSKYSTTMTGTGSASIAKWSFKVNGVSSETQNFDLAFTINPNENVIENKVAPRNKWIF